MTNIIHVKPADMIKAITFDKDPGAPFCQCCLDLETGGVFRADELPAAQIEDGPIARKGKRYIRIPSRVEEASQQLARRVLTPGHGPLTPEDAAVMEWITSICPDCQIEYINAPAFGRFVYKPEVGWCHAPRPATQP